jgi:hypothetical protein
MGKSRQRILFSNIIKRGGKKKNSVEKQNSNYIFEQEKKQKTYILYTFKIYLFDTIQIIVLWITQRVQTQNICVKHAPNKLASI